MFSDLWVPKSGCHFQMFWQKKEPHTQPNTNPSALLGRERLVNMGLSQLLSYLFSQPSEGGLGWRGLLPVADLLC